MKCAGHRRPPLRSLAKYDAVLSVYIVWHPQFARGAEIAARIYTHFSQDGSLPGIRQGVGVPSFFRSAPTDPTSSTNTAPRAIDFSAADHTAVIALFDVNMHNAKDSGWQQYFQTMLSAFTTTGPYRLFPVTFGLSGASFFGTTQSISLRRSAEQDYTELKDYRNHFTGIISVPDDSALHSGTALKQLMNTLFPTINIAKTDENEVQISKICSAMRDQMQWLQEIPDSQDVANGDKAAVLALLKSVRTAYDEHTNLLHDITHQLARLLLKLPRAAQHSTNETLSHGPVKLFLSHAKRDGEEMTKRLLAYIHQNLSVETFFDKTVIASGAPDFGREIKGEIEGAAVLVFLTDYYASRPWCQREILYAKEFGRPILVLDALQTGEARTFPYLGNCPTIRYQDTVDGYNSAVGYLLREVLRSEHFKLYVKKLKAIITDINPQTVGIPYPPELLTAMGLKKQREESGSAVQSYVYPDPPIGLWEMAVVSALDRTLHWTTPTLLLSDTATIGNDRPLHEFRGKEQPLRVGLSISDSPELAELGFGQTHLMDAFAEISRHLLAAGAVLATGHDLRTKGGFGQALLQLAQSYFADREQIPRPIQTYLRWPLFQTLTIAERTKFALVTEFHDCPEPKSDEPPGEALRVMRENMNKNIDARIFLGGKIVDSKGPLPGIAQEAWLALESNKAVFLLGAFGGATLDIIKVLKGQIVPRMTRAWQEEHRGSVMKEWDDWCSKQGRLLTQFEPLPSPFGKDEWWKRLHNGLNEAENERLATTIYIPEMIALILRGLTSRVQSRL